MTKVYAEPTERGFQVFKTYRAVLLHFTTSYDYHKYRGKVKVKPETYRACREVITCEILAERYNHEELVGYFVANLINADVYRKWLGGMRETVYTDWLKVQESLFQHFTDTVNTLLREIDESPLGNFNDLFIWPSGNMPPILEKYCAGDLSLEVLCVFFRLLKLEAKYEKSHDSDLVYMNIKDRVKKYTPFLKVDYPKYRKLLIERVKYYELD